MSSSTDFATRPMDVAELTAPEFTYDIEWYHPPSFAEVCGRFGIDVNRATAWLIRFLALHTWWARDGMAQWLIDAAGRPRDICEVAARLELNELREFDRERVLFGGGPAHCSAAAMRTPLIAGQGESLPRDPDGHAMVIGRRLPAVSSWASGPQRVLRQNSESIHCTRSSPASE